MTAAGRTSLVIVSRDRPEMLDRCLTAVGQLDHPDFEVVVVTDPATAPGLRARGLPLKLALCEPANVALARNIGIGLAAAPVVAFLDDDAVPEPTWLSRLSAAFADPEVDAAGGFVRGRNGISLQWTAGTVDRLTRPGPLPVPRGMVSKHRGRPGHGIEIKGCNCAYRREVLVRLGGFDPALAYYLDETELNLRLGLHGLTTAVVPMAQVLHSKMPNARRGANLRPLTLKDVGASTALVLRRHGVTEVERAGVLGWLERERRRQLLAMMVDGRLEPRDIGRLMATLAEGWQAGSTADLPDPAVIAETPEDDFRPFPAGPRAGQVIAGPSWRAARVLAEARAAAGAGRVATALILSPTPMAHRVGFDPSGVWVQRGGLFGRSERTGARLQFWRFAARVRREIRRIAPFRPVSARGPVPAPGPDGG